MTVVTLRTASAPTCGVAQRTCVSGREGKGRYGKGLEWRDLVQDQSRYLTVGAPLLALDRTER